MPPQPGPSKPPAPTVALSHSIMTKLKPARVFSNIIDLPPEGSAHGQKQPALPPRQITGLSFDDRGDQLVSSADDESFRLFNCKTGKHLKTFYSKKYGVDLPRFTHKNTAILHASTKEDDTIRYHSLHDNKYLQYFKGHKARVVSLEMSPMDDGFLSASEDLTVRLWDLRAPACRGLLNVPGVPVTAWDPNGVVFAVGVNAYSQIMLYDTGNFDKKPFISISLVDRSLERISFPPRPIYMTSLSFSSDGKYILAGCSGNAHYIMDSFDGTVLAKLVGHQGLERRSENAQPTMHPQKGISGEEVSWTPDSKFIVGGSVDGKIYTWDVSGIPPSDPAHPPAIPLAIHPISAVDGHPGAARCVRFNPRFAMMATASSELAMWLPEPGGDIEETAAELLGKRKAPSS
ncbi:WD40 repeat-like protein [Cylindrobasidium torrendii FP15055 ss-10]|uniref:WD40 repeat-like protein n=1 Tax=Cylindrobasidium torrendii FP15055 ss-10 TaxID=1314674 RepID=A0A0D7B4W3_9AGAR|nr:WD40 repeat-like protein [Cylindrobasidium torrendii FP15055 ss-10]